MPDQKYDSFANIKALEEERGRIIKMFDDVEKGILKLKSLGVDIGTAKTVKGVKGLTDEFDKQNKTLNEQQKQLIKMAENLAKFTTQEAKQIEAVRQVTSLTKQLTSEEIKHQTVRQAEYANLQQQKIANADLAKSIQLRIKLRNAEKGSEDELSLKYQKAINIIKKLSEAQKQSARGESLQKFAADTKKALDAAQQKVGNFKGNVGNYTKSLEGLFDNVANEIKRLRAETEQLERTKVSGFLNAAQLAETEQKINKNTSAISELGSVMAIGEKTGQNFSQTVKQIGFQFSNLSVSGNQSVDFLDRFKVDAAQAKDSAQDLKDEIKALSSDTRKLDLAVGTISVFASGMEAAAGAAALLGADTEDVQKATRNLVAIQSVANGVREVGKQITERGTAANKAYNFVVQQGTILFGKGSTAAQRFGAALKGIVILAVVGFIIQLVQSMGSFEDKAEDAQKELKKFNDELERNKRITSSIAASDEFDFKANIEDIKRNGQEREKLAKDEDERLKISHETKKKLFDAERGFRRESLSKQQVELENAKEDLLRVEIKQNQFRKALLEQGVTKISKERGEAMKATLDAATENVERLKTTIQNGQRDLILFEKGLLTEQSTEENELAKKRISDAEERAKREKKAALDLFTFEQNLLKEKAESDAGEGSLNNIKTRLKAVEAGAIAEMNILDATNKYEKEQSGLTKSELLLINAKYVEEKQKISDKAERAITNIIIEEDQKRIASAREASDDFDRDMEERFQTAATQRTKDFEKEQKQIETNAAESQRLNVENLENKLITQVEFENQKIKIETDAQRIILDSQIRFYEREAAIMKAAGKDTTELDLALAKARESLATGRLSGTRAIVDQERENLKQLQQNYKDAFFEIQNTVANVFGAIAEREKDRLQDQINLIEERKAKEIEAITASGDSEEKKAARIKIIEAKAQSDREVLEKRQRQIERQKAVIERSVKAFQIITDTIRAVAAIKAQMAVLSATPATLSLVPLAASQLIVAIASGASALAALLATPLPKAERGVESSARGLHQVAEKGREMGISPKGNITIWKQPQTAFLEQGTKVLTNKETEQKINAIGKIKKMIESEKNIEKINEVINSSDVHRLFNKSELTFSTVEEAKTFIKSLPKFEKGTESSPAGLAHVGERGREMVVGNDKIKVFDKPTIVNLEKGTKILSNKETEEKIEAIKSVRELVKKETDVSVVNEFINAKNIFKSKVNFPDLSSVKAFMDMLPKFYKGTDNAPEGFAHVAERGREIGVEKDGKVKIWEKPTIAYLKQGTKVMTNRVTEDIIAASTKDIIHPAIAFVEKSRNKDDEIIYELKQLRKIQHSVKIFNGMDIESTVYYQTQMKH